jgi:hypothetical protein
MMRPAACLGHGPDRVTAPAVVAQGYTMCNTVPAGVGLAVITGTEDRQHGYVALTRGTDANLAYVFTTSPRRADPVPGPRPAPELARYEQIHPERTGEPAPATLPARPGALHLRDMPAHHQKAGTRDGVLGQPLYGPSGLTTTTPVCDRPRTTAERSARQGAGARRQV